MISKRNDVPDLNNRNAPMCQVCGRELQRHGTREFTPPFKPTADWCPDHGYWWEQKR